MKDLYTEVLKLRDQKSLNSKNSSKSPSTDVNKPAPKSLRGKSNNKPGGQKGHEGSTLQQFENPDEVKEHKIVVCEHCEHCEGSLDGVDITDQIIRQEIDIVPAKIIIREHRGDVKICPCCAHKKKAVFPDGINNPIQYGNVIKSKIVYFNENHLIPYARLQQIMEDEYGLHISTGSMVNFKKEGYAKSAVTASIIKNKIINSSVAHFDETGVKINGKLHWMHTASTDTLTYFEVSAKRGLKGMNSANILPKFSGVAVHDHWKSYFSYEGFSNALCNAHHLRELTFAEERYSQKWAIEMKGWLININEKVKSHKERGMTRFNQQTIGQYEARYDKILRCGKKELPNILATKGPSPTKGKQKKHKVENLHERLINFKHETLIFMHGPFNTEVQFFAAA